MNICVWSYKGLEDKVFSVDIFDGWVKFLVSVQLYTFRREHADARYYWKFERGLTLGQTQIVGLMLKLGNT